MNKRQKIEEYIKCQESFIYAIESNLTVDAKGLGYIPFKLHPQQKRLVKALRNNGEYSRTLITKSRQIGASTTSIAYCAALLVLASLEKREAVYVVCNVLSTAKKFLKDVKFFIDQFPKWMVMGWKESDKNHYRKNSTIEIELHNGSFLKVLAAGKSLRSHSPTLLILDECGFFDVDPVETRKAALGSISAGGSICMISTPNGLDALYYKTYNEAINGENDFKIVEMRWYLDPRSHKNFHFRKYDDEGNIIEKIPLEEFNEEIIFDYINRGYKPWSDWYDDKRKEAGYDERIIRSEYDAEFLGSGANGVAQEIISKHENDHVMKPIRVGQNGDLEIFFEPIEGHKYIIGADVATGDGTDYSGFHIVDTDEMEFAATYKGKCDENELAAMLYDMGITYNYAYMVIDVTGGVGGITVNELEAKGYKNLHYHYDNVKQFNKKNSGTGKKKTAGVSINNKNRHIITSKVVEYSSNYDIKIRSQKLIEELKTWIWVNGRLDHQRGYNDDLIIALGIILYVLEYTFKKIETDKEKSKNMLSAWTSSSNSEMVIKTLKKKENRNGKYEKMYIKGMRQRPHNNTTHQQWLMPSIEKYFKKNV